METSGAIEAATKRVRAGRVVDHAVVIQRETWVKFDTGRSRATLTYVASARAVRRGGPARSENATTVKCGRARGHSGRGRVDAMRGHSPPPFAVRRISNGTCGFHSGGFPSSSGRSFGGGTYFS